MRREAKTENDRVASPESVPIHLKNKQRGLIGYVFMSMVLQI